MGIYKPNKLEKGHLFVRFFKWDDPNKGWGDAGTAFYAKVPIEKFDIVDTFDTKWPKPETHRYEYKLNTKKGIEMMGNYWWMNKGYDEVDPERQQKEIADLEAKLKIAKEVKVFS